MVTFDIFAVSPLELRLHRVEKIAYPISKVLAILTQPNLFIGILPCRSRKITATKISAVESGQNFSIEFADAVITGQFQLVDPDPAGGTIVLTWKEPTLEESTIIIEVNPTSDYETELLISQNPFADRDTRASFNEAWSESVQRLKKG